MKRITSATLAAAAILSLAACNRAEDPADVRADVADAQEEAREQIAEARQDAARTGAEASEDTREAARELALAEAKGAHDVAVEKCGALSGDAQNACQRQADAEFEAAKARAESNAATPAGNSSIAP